MELDQHEGIKEGVLMNSWQLMFLQNRANNSFYYFGDSLATQNWAWPQGTWFQKRLRYLRKKQRQSGALWGPQDAGSGGGFVPPKYFAGAAFGGK
jgi:hypothetical protein